MKKMAELPFDPKAFLAKADTGRTISKYRMNQIIFSQGDLADCVFYIQDGKVKVTVISEHGRKPSWQSWGRMNSAAKVAWPASRGAWRRLWQ